MNRILRIILIVLGIGLVMSYMVVMYHHVAIHADDEVCSGVRIQILDSTERTFISSREVMSLLRTKEMMPSGKKMTEVNCGEMEQMLRQQPVVRDAQCYTNTQNEVCIEITQREPILRVIADENYFVDTERHIIPVRANTASYVVLASGRIGKEWATNELFDFAQYISEDEFWKAQIVQIYVRDKHNIELVPRVGSGVILLGGLDGYEKKLRKLQKLYDDGFSKIGWKDYKEIDLRYKGQVVCR